MASPVLNASAPLGVPGSSTPGVGLGVGPPAGHVDISLLECDPEDSLLVEVQGENGAYYRAHVRDVFPGSSEMLLSFERDWQPESRFPLARIRLPAAKPSLEASFVEGQEVEVFSRASVDRFIRVVEVTESSTRVSAPPTTVGHPIRPNTREEIRKKLAASFGSTHHDSDPELRPNGFRKGFLPADNHDLQICFINEVVSSGEDDDHDDHDDEDPRTDSTCGVDQKEDSSEDSDTEEAVYPRSRIDWESFRNPDLESPQALQSPPASSHRDEKRRRKFKKKLSKLQKEVQVNLSDCQAIAKKLVDKERLKRGQNNPLRQLLGVSNDRFTLSQLGTYNFASLQVIVNHLHNQIESHNQELVQLLIQKDELQIEQDSQLLDIEDLTHNLPLSQTL